MFLLATLNQAADRPVLVALMAQALLDPDFAATLRTGLLDPRREALVHLLSGPGPVARSARTRTSTF